jgi:hypothetical protein
MMSYLNRSKEKTQQERKERVDKVKEIRKQLLIRG